MGKQSLAVAVALVASLAVPSAASPVPQPPELWTIAPDGSKASIATGPEGAVLPRDFEWSPDGSRLVFMKQGDIWVSNPDGTGQVDLTNSQDEEYDPHWSPNGDEVVFFRITGVGSDLYVAEADGSGIRALTTEEGYESMPRWSPTGEWILFQSRCIDCPEDLELIRPDGTERVAITDDDVRDLTAVWSPDGSQIAIVRGTGASEGNELWVVDVASAELTLLTDVYGAGAPEWNPDGSRLLVARASGLAVVDAATGVITEGLPGAAVGPSSTDWSPAGDEIAYSNQDGIFVYELATDVVRQIAPQPPWFQGDDVPRTSFDLDWAPDGSLIAFANGPDLAVVSPDGSGLRNLLATEREEESAPTWSPDSSRIAYLMEPIFGGGWPISVSMVASRSKVVYDRTFRLGGTVEKGDANAPDECIAGVTVTLGRTVVGETETEIIGSATTDENGGFRFLGLRADRSANYVTRIEWPCAVATSVAVPVEVRKKVTLSGPPIAGGRVRLKADVEPCKGHRHDKVLLQKRKDGRWVTVDRDRSDDLCRAVFVQDVGRRSVFRAKAPKTDADHLAGTSPTLVIHVD